LEGKGLTSNWKQRLNTDETDWADLEASCRFT
jgi:hypothetical protein